MLKEYFEKFVFNDLFVLDIANNHQGCLDHGINIINSCADVVQSNGVRGAIKFQFRDLPNFIHAEERRLGDNKHTQRFLSTKLSWEDFDKLVGVVRDRGLIAMCTPFDETSVDRIVQMGFDIIKVASCSAQDWPLLDKIASVDIPVIASTGGLYQHEVDDLVSHLTHRGCDFALMHCVSIYPTPDEACNLGNIAGFRKRYPGKVIGWSTHEPPDDTVQVGLATALGAEMFERHVGLETNEFKLNAYSSTPEQLNNWIAAYKRSKLLIGSGTRNDILPMEREAIGELTRGVFAKGRIEPGAEVTRDQVYFAFPNKKNQITSGRWRDGIVMSHVVESDEPLMLDDASLPGDPDEYLIKKAIHEVKGLLAYAGVPLSHEFTTEYSHHYGVRNFASVGVVLITVVNREYAKKILVQLPGQRHPLHFHKLKEETFIVLWGELISELDGRERILKPGDTLTVPPGVWHCFRTNTGCVFEEISTTAFADDSVYRDPAINTLTSRQRKTVVDHWGRFQITEQLRGVPL